MQAMLMKVKVKFCHRFLQNDEKGESEKSAVVLIG